MLQGDIRGGFTNNLNLSPRRMTGSIQYRIYDNFPKKTRRNNPR